MNQAAAHALATLGTGQPRVHDDEAAAIVRDLAAQDAPIAHRGYDEHPECTHCDTYRPDGVQDHDPTCPWARAVAWCAANPVEPPR